MRTGLLFAVSAMLAFAGSTTHARTCAKQSHTPVDVASYYASANGLTGDALKSALNQIIRSHKAYRYSPCVWEILKEADEDPDNPNNVLTIYTGESIPKASQVSGHTRPNTWNREHVWAKSHGFKSKGQHAHTDAHHIVASNPDANSERGNLDFKAGGEPARKCSKCRKGADTWEPPDSAKGAVARMMLYMAVRYEGGDSSRVGDLELVNRGTEIGESRFGHLDELLDWHCRFPPDEREIRRNVVVHSWQGNRNPFVDRPEFAEAIWGGECQRDGVEPQPEAPPETSPADDSRDAVRAVLERIDAIEAELRALREAVEAMRR